MRFPLNPGGCGAPALLISFVFLAAALPDLCAQAPQPPLQDRVAAVGASPLRADFSPGATFTLELWVFPTTAPNFDWMAGKAYGAPGVDPHLSFALLLPATRRPQFSLGIRPGVSSSAQSPNPIPLRTWTHLAGVSDGTTLRLFVNGTLVASAPSPGIPAAPAGVPFSLGRAILPDGGTNFYPFPGYARHIRLWSVARSAAQIATSLGEELPTDRTGLVAAWPLDDEPGTRTLRELAGTGPALTTGGLSSARTSLVAADPFYADTVSPRDNATSAWLHQGVLIDFDGDGDLDAVYAQINYSQASGGTPSRLRAFRNTAGTFTDVTDAVLGTVTLVHPRHQLVADFNGDGRPDILFAGQGYDFPPYPGEKSRLLIGTPDGRLVEDPARLPSGNNKLPTTSPPPISTAMATLTSSSATSRWTSAARASTSTTAVATLPKTPRVPPPSFPAPNPRPTSPATSSTSTATAGPTSCSAPPSTRPTTC